MPLRLITNRDRSESAAQPAGEEDELVLSPEHPERLDHPEQAEQPETPPPPSDGPPSAPLDVLTAAEHARHLLEDILSDRAPPGTAEHFELLSSAYSLLDEIRRTSAAVRERFEHERRSRAAFHDELSEALSEQVGLREAVESERAGHHAAAERVAELEARLAAEQAERTRVLEAHHGERRELGERVAALEAELAAERDRHRPDRDEVAAEPEAPAQGDLASRGAGRARERSGSERKAVAAGERIAALEAGLAAERSAWARERSASERERIAASKRNAALEVGLVAERSAWERERLAGAQRLAELESTLAAERADRERERDTHRRELHLAAARLAELERALDGAGLPGAASFPGDGDALAGPSGRPAESEARIADEDHALARERGRWLDERRSLEARLSEQAQARERLQRAYDEACAERERLQSTKASLEAWMESMLERHAPEERSGATAGTDGPAAGGADAHLWSSPVEARRLEATGAGHEARSDVPNVPPVSSEELARAEQALVGDEEARRRDLAELRTHLGTVHAALLVDDVEHLHGCVAGEEIPGLIESLHRLECFAPYRIAMGEEDGHPTLGEVGMPVTHFLVGVLPDYLLDATETLLRASEAPWHGDAVGTVESQFEKLVKLHDVLNDLFGHVLEAGILVLPSSLTGVAEDWRTPDSEACVDPLSALDALYHAVDRRHAEDLGEELALLDDIVALNVWRDVDGARVEPGTQRKLLYLMLRLVNSARVVLADAFALIQEIQRAAR